MGKDLGMRNVRIKSQHRSQTDKLRDQMVDLGMGHLDGARADIHGFGVDGDFEGFFCDTALENVQMMETGDGTRLPDNAVVKGIEVPELGYYDIIGARIYSNGQIVVYSDEETVIRREKNPDPRFEDIDPGWAEVHSLD